MANADELQKEARRAVDEAGGTLEQVLDDAGREIQRRLGRADGGPSRGLLLFAVVAIAIVTVIVYGSRSGSAGDRYEDEWA